MYQHIQPHEATDIPSQRKRLIPMSKRIVSLATISALTLVSLGAAPATADEMIAIHGAKTVGALAFETRGLATDDLAVHRQGGYAIPGSVQWIKTPAQAPVRQAAF